MTALSTTRRVLAIAAAAGCTTGALTVLLQDIIGPPLEMLAHWEIHHTAAVLTVAVVILMGELFWDATGEQRWGAAAGFALVTTLGIVMVVNNSVDNQVGVASTAAGRNAERAEARAELTTAKKALADARNKVTTEAANRGCGRNCEGVKGTLPILEQAVRDAEKLAKEKGADEPVGKAAQRIAEALALLGASKERTEALITMFDPFLRTLFWEFGSIVCWGFVRERRRQPSPAATAEATVDAKLAELRNRFFAPDNDADPQPTPPGNRRRRKLPSPATPVATVAQRPTATVIQLRPGNRAEKVSEAEALAWLKAHMAGNGFLPDQDTMATELDVHKGSVAKWMRKWEAERIIERTQQGRCKVVRLTAEPASA